MERHGGEGVAHQLGRSDPGGVGMPSPTDAFLGIHSARYRGRNEAWTISSRS
jgi:hypothetical protein